MLWAQARCTHMQVYIEEIYGLNAPNYTPEKGKLIQDQQFTQHKEIYGPNALNYTPEKEKPHSGSTIYNMSVTNL